MNLRPELLPPPVPPERLGAVSREIEQICGLLNRESPEAASSIAAFNAMTGHFYSPSDFAEYWESRNLEEFALEAVRPAWPRVRDVTRDELIEVTQRILGDPVSPNSPYYLLILKANVPHPAVTDLIFWPALGTEPTAEEIIDNALAYQPIVL